MILVTLGTQDRSFIRLLKAIDKAIDDKIITEEVIVQSGHTSYKSENMKIFDYINIDEFKVLLDEANLIITHGGVGTIMNALSLDKKIIGCARLFKYHEHQNDHQIEILEQFNDEGYLIYAEDLDNFNEYLIKAKTFIPRKYKSNTENVIKYIREFINNN